MYITKNCIDKNEFNDIIKICKQLYTIWNTSLKNITIDKIKLYLNNKSLTIIIKQYTNNFNNLYNRILLIENFRKNHKIFINVINCIFNNNANVAIL